MSENKLQIVNKAIRDGDLPTVKSNLDDELLNAEVTLGNWLHTAAARGQLEILKYLADRGLSINAKDGYSGKRAISKAAAKGHKDVVDYLLSIGAEVDVSDAVVNPLFDAIMNNHVEVARSLISTGMDITVKYTIGGLEQNALDFAKDYKRSEIVSIIEESEK